MVSLTEFRSSYVEVEPRETVTLAAFTRSRLSEDENIEQLGQELLALVDQYQCRKLVLSLGRVEYVTSSVVGKLITLHRRLHRKHGQLVLCELQPAVREILKSSRLLEYFHTAGNRDEALAILEADES